jgi:putative DNA primase/helicase
LNAKESPFRPARPPAPEVFKIPVEFRSLRQWVLWKYELRGDTWTKIPYQPSKPSLKAKADVPDTWGSFDLAWEAYQTGDFDGIGFEFSADDEFFGVDVDKCLSEQGEILEWAAPILESLRTTYGEISPSGRGIKFIARGKLPMDTGTRRPGMGDGSGALELYDHGRFFTLTGQRFADGIFPNDLQSVADKLYALAKERPKAAPTTPAETDGHSGPFVMTVTGSNLEARVIGYLAKCEPAVSGQGGHDKTFGVACRVGPGFDLSEDEAFRYLRDHFNPRCEPPWDERDLRRKVSEGFKVESRRGWLLDSPGRQSNGHASSTIVSANGAAPVANSDRDAINRKLAKFARTDLGNGERLVTRFGASVRYCHPWKKWVVWDRQRWKTDNTAAAHRLAKRTVRGILKEAATVEDDDERKAHNQFWHASEGKARVEAMLSCAASEGGIPILPDDMDRDSFLLNVENGTIDLRTGKLRPHQREDLITRIAPVKFLPDAKCPTWLRVLDEIFARDSGLIRFWKMLCGICLTGDVSNQILPVLYGSGANGKTTILTVLLELLGPDYAITAPPGLLTMKKGERHPTELASLFSKRLVVDSETAEGAQFNENLVKQLTGGDKISARRMREDYWEFFPTHKILMCTNHKPEIKETKNAIWRRVKLVPFNVAIADDKQDARLPERLRAEYPGILAWCVEGCLDWQELGLEIPAAVEDATQQYRRESDVIGEFLEAECTVMPELRARATPLYARYQRWAGGDAVNQRKFGKAMADRGFKKHANNGTEYLGIGLRSEGTEGSGRDDYA